MYMQGLVVSKEESSQSAGLSVTSYPTYIYLILNLYYQIFYDVDYIVAKQVLLQYCGGVLYFLLF